MLTRLLLILILALIQAGCEHGETGYDIVKPWDLETVRSRLEREKREFLKIEDLRVGNGAIASWRRRLKAEIEVRYADGTVIYKGPIVTYFGFNGLQPSDLQDRFMLDWITQPGIQLGLNGMAVGGKRRITIDRELVCEGAQDSSTFGRAGCYLLRVERNFVNEISVRKDTLIVDAALTESCAPLRLRIRPGGTLTLVDVGAGCQTKDQPAAGGADWRIY
jgi:hypothetical protein